MERLTERTAEGLPFYPRCFEHCGGHPDGDRCLSCSLEDERLEKLAAYEDICHDPAVIAKQLEILKLYADCLQGIGLGQLGTLTALFREGRLFILPCKIGDTVYQTDGVRVYESTVRKLIFDTETIAFDVDAVNRTVFTTREAAEMALLFGNKKGGNPQ